MTVIDLEEEKNKRILDNFRLTMLQELEKLLETPGRGIWVTKQDFWVPDAKDEPSED